MIMVLVWSFAILAMILMIATMIVGMRCVIMMRVPVAANMSRRRSHRILCDIAAMMMPHHVMQPCMTEQSCGRVGNKRQSEEKQAKHCWANTTGNGCRNCWDESDSGPLPMSIKMQSICKKDFVTSSATSVRQRRGVWKLTHKNEIPTRLRGRIRNRHVRSRPDGLVSELLIGRCLFDTQHVTIGPSGAWRLACRDDQRPNERRRIEKICNECGFATLAAIRRQTVEEWLAQLAEGGTGPRRRNIYLEAFRAFLRWAVSSYRILDDPLEGIARADQTVDIRKERRPLSDGEFRDLLTATLLRPLAEHGRETIMLEKEDGKRSSWTYEPLTLANIDAAVERARKKLARKPDFIEAKLLLGRERVLIIKTLSMTGLRRGELAALRIRNLYLDELQPYIKVDRESEKNRKGNTIPLRSDLANDLRQWISDRAASAQETAHKMPDIGRLSGDELLFNVPDRHTLVKILDKDYAVAGIPKIDDNGLSVDVHCLRHSFATWIGESGISPKSAQRLMRHSDVNLTMRYTHANEDNDVRGLDSLPQVQSSYRPVQASVTGTDGDFKTAPMFAPDTGRSVHPESYCGNPGKNSGTASDSVSVQKKPENPVKQGISGHSLKYTREDSNLQPPVPKTGETAPQSKMLSGFLARQQMTCPIACPSNRKPTSKTLSVWGQYPTSKLLSH